MCFRSNLTCVKTLLLTEHTEGRGRTFLARHFVVQPSGAKFSVDKTSSPGLSSAKQVVSGKFVARLFVAETLRRFPLPRLKTMMGWQTRTGPKASHESLRPAVFKILWTSSTVQYKPQDKSNARRRNVHTPCVLPFVSLQKVWVTKCPANE